MVMANPPLEVRPPRECEWPICRMLVPTAFAEGRGVDCRLAVTAVSPYIVGAVGFRPAGAEWSGIAVHVVPSFRRQGIGASLIDHLVDEAGAAGVPALRAWIHTRRDPDSAPFLATRAFVVGETLYEVEGDLAAMWAPVQSLCKRLKSDHRIPQTLSVTALVPEDWESVLALHATHIADNPRLAAGGLPIARFPQLRAHSCALRREGSLVGALLCNCHGDLVTTSTLIVPPGAGAPWAAALLLAHAMESAWAAGARRARYEFRADNMPMRNLTRRFGMRTIGERTAMVRAVD